MAKGKYKNSDCIILLQQKQEMLNSNGEIRYPQRSDFTTEEVVAIKAFLGPWPRALEISGLKLPRNDDKKLLDLEKRIRTKRRRTEAKKQAKKVV